MRALLIACALLGSAAAIAQTAPIGRLFYTPAERAQLDMKRGGVQAPPPDPVPQPAAPVATPEPVTLDGIMRRSSGRATLWLNQAPQDATGAVGRGAAYTLRLPSGQQVLVKPGQRVDMSAGTVRDSDAAR
jgi:hypothetical protein